MASYSSFVEIYGKSTLVAKTITELRLKKRRQLCTKLFLGNLILNDIQKPLRRTIENLKSTKWHLIVTKLVDMLIKTGHWSHEPKDIRKRMLKDATRNENQLRNCLRDQKYNLQTNFQREMDNLKCARTRIQALHTCEFTPLSDCDHDDNDDEYHAKSKIAAMQNYIFQQSLLVRALGHAINHDRFKYLNMMNCYMSVSEDIAMDCIRHEKKMLDVVGFGVDNSFMRDFDVLGNLEHCHSQIQQQVYFLDQIGWWFIDSTSSNEDILKWLSTTKKTPQFIKVVKNFFKWY
tara:strand:- start:8065 stop:8934 length:870 start_codon:yes stop_codon:yes gene_type:complete